MKIKINRYNLGNTYKKRIILISDIHYFNKKIINDLYYLLEEIKKQKPDYICISGDTTDDIYIKDKEELVKWFKDLSKICKVIIEIGNHEFYYKHVLKESYDKELYNKIDRIKNVYVLDNQVHSEFGINFIGVTLPYEYFDTDEQEEELIYFMNRKYRNLSRGYNILLCHSPHQIAKESVMRKLKCHKDIDLVLSGHMHAGLSFEWSKKILKGRGLVSPKKALFPKHCYGLYKIDNTKVIISTGVTKLAKSHIFGLFNFLYKSEIIVIDI